MKKIATLAIAAALSTVPFAFGAGQNTTPNRENNTTMEQGTTKTKKHEKKHARSKKHNKKSTSQTSS